MKNWPMHHWFSCHWLEYCTQASQGAVVQYSSRAVEDLYTWCVRACVRAHKCVWWLAHYYRRKKLPALKTGKTKREREDNFSTIFVSLLDNLSDASAASYSGFKKFFAKLIRAKNFASSTLLHAAPVFHNTWGGPGRCLQPLSLKRVFFGK